MKKSLFIWWFVGGISFSAFGQLPREYQSYIWQMDSLYMTGNFAEASLTFDKALRVAESVNAKPTGWYNAACCAARAGETEVAFARLFSLLELESNWYQDDPFADTDLQSLHTDARWKIYADTLFQRKERIEQYFDKPLRNHLQQLGQRDQQIRIQYLNAYNTQPQNEQLTDSLLREMQLIDKENETEICQILDECGWIGRKVVGDACTVFWVIIQHAPVELQKKYLPLFRQGVSEGDLSASDVAMMEDRICLFEDRPQRYGSQIVEQDGRRVIYKLEDASKVDEWRQEIGMIPLDVYLKQMNATMH